MMRFLGKRVLDLLQLKHNYIYLLKMGRGLMRFAQSCETHRNPSEISLPGFPPKIEWLLSVVTEIEAENNNTAMDTSEKIHGLVIDILERKLRLKSQKIFLYLLKLS